MKLNIYIFKNEYLGCTGQPIFQDKEPDVFVKNHERFLKAGEAQKVFEFENTTLFHMGSFDDESMKFDLRSEPLLLCRSSDIISTRKDYTAKEGEANVSDSN